MREQYVHRQWGGGGAEAWNWEMMRELEQGERGRVSRRVPGIPKERTVGFLKRFTLKREPPGYIKQVFIWQEWFAYANEDEMSTEPNARTAPILPYKVAFFSSF